MCNISQSCDQRFDVNCGPQSEVIVLGTLKGLSKKKLKHVHMLLECTLQIGDEHVAWAKERASDWRCVQSKRVKEKLYSEQYKRYNLSLGHHCG